jgi:hypothetical protein
MLDGERSGGGARDALTLGYFLSRFQREDQRALKRSLQAGCLRSQVSPRQREDRPPLTNHCPLLRSLAEKDADALAFRVGSNDIEFAIAV